MRCYKRKVNSPREKTSPSGNRRIQMSRSNGESRSLATSSKKSLTPPPISLIATASPLLRKKDSHEEKTETDKKPKKNLHPIRVALLEQFEKFKDQRIGDEKFEKDVMTEEAFNEINKDYFIWAKKRAEKYREYMKAVKKIRAYNRGKEPKDKKRDPPRPKMGPQPLHYTTCIAIQGIILKKAFESVAKTNHKIKETGSYTFNSKGRIVANKDAHGKAIRSKKYNFSTFAHKQASEEEVGAWTKAEPHITQRPNEGDILVLGKKTNAKNAARFVKNHKKVITKIETKIEDLDEDIEKLKTTKIDAEATLTILTDSPEDIGDKNAQIRAKARASAALTNANKRIAALKGVKKDLERVLRLQKKNLLKAEASEKYHIENLNFSHVGFFIEKLDEQTTAEGVKIEKWKTFDGGQDVSRVKEGTKDGAKYSIRTYFPATNEISGEDGQEHLGGKKTLLSGWVDVEKLIQK